MPPSSFFSSFSLVIFRTCHAIEILKYLWLKTPNTGNCSVYYELPPAVIFGHNTDKSPSKCHNSQQIVSLGQLSTITCSLLTALTKKEMIFIPVWYVPDKKMTNVRYQCIDVYTFLKFFPLQNNEVCQFMLRKLITNQWLINLLSCLSTRITEGNLKVQWNNATISKHANSDQFPHMQLPEVVGVDGEEDDP